MAPQLRAHHAESNAPGLRFSCRLLAVHTGNEHDADATPLHPSSLHGPMTGAHHCTPALELKPSWMGAADQIGGEGSQCWSWSRSSCNRIAAVLFCAPVWSGAGWACWSCQSWSTRLPATSLRMLSSACSSSGWSAESGMEHAHLSMTCDHGSGPAVALQDEWFGFCLSSAALEGAGCLHARHARAPTFHYSVVRFCSDKSSRLRSHISCLCQRAGDCLLGMSYNRSSIGS